MVKLSATKKALENLRYSFLLEVQKKSLRDLDEEIRKVRKQAFSKGGATKPNELKELIKKDKTLRLQLGIKTPKDCKDERRGTGEGTQIEDTRSEEEKAIEIEKIE